jgi:hypothetical protein
MGTEGIEPPSPGLEPGSLPLAYAPLFIILKTNLIFKLVYFTTTIYKYLEDLYVDGIPS